MWLKEISITNFKSFSNSGRISLSKGINLLIGANNAGKSTILRCAHLLQGYEGKNFQGDFLQKGLRIGMRKASVRLTLAEPLKALTPKYPWTTAIDQQEPNLEFVAEPHGLTVLVNTQAGRVGVDFPTCHQSEPHNFIYPYFARRKPANFNTTINGKNSTLIEESYSHLPAKVDRVSSYHHPSFQAFNRLCQECLGLPISTVFHESGKQPAFLLPDDSHVPVELMGEGTMSVLAFLAHLCSAKGKLFLIEEPENDIHPKALKSLLGFIAEKSKENQFIISTHSNIVLRILGSLTQAKVFSVKMELDPSARIPTSTCTEISTDPLERVALLADLGYEASDLYFYKAYLILEESTAERIIRDFIIPYLFPKLQGVLKTIAAGGVTKVDAHFIDFHRLFVFLHTCSQYHQRAWAAVDAGPDGEAVIAELRGKFKDWPSNHFRCFGATEFETYYPPNFKEEATSILALKKGPEKQKLKGQLVEKVVAWCIENKEEAEEWFTTSAPDVLALLSEIEQTIFAKK